MLALVTGGSGHLGANLVRALISRGWNVRALVHQDTRALDGTDAEQVQGNILNAESLRKACRGVDAVFHLAARISLVRHDREQVEAINITGVRNVVEACFSAGVKRLIHTSSFHAQVQEPLDEPLDEDRPLLDTDNCPPYNHSKAEGERIVRAAINKGLDAVIITPSAIIGPYDFGPSHFGATIMLLARKKLKVLVRAGMDWVDARDAAEGMINACEKAAPGDKFILSGHRISILEIARMIDRLNGNTTFRPVLPLNVARVFVPLVSSFDRIKGNRQLITPISIKELESNRCLSHEKAGRELGYKPRPFEETLHDTLEWFRENGYLNNPVSGG